MVLTAEVDLSVLVTRIKARAVISTSTFFHKAEKGRQKLAMIDLCRRPSDLMIIWFHYPIYAEWRLRSGAESVSLTEGVPKQPFLWKLRAVLTRRANVQAHWQRPRWHAASWRITTSHPDEM
jgi:hypothetical protein